mmetsp:Transcript_28983/g.92675  ORF Transcript_28983/g.92675 Transcript_28983/m.92675 type:complete len:198 (+) Transcript_28983:703-1296(+)
MARGLEPTDGIAQGLLLGLLISGSSAALAAAAKPGTAEAEKKHLARIAAEAGVAPDAPEARFLFETRLQAIAALPECAVRESDQQRHATCSICLEATAAGDVIKKLPCAHKFHSKCIDAWLFHSPLCPFCRRSITTLDRWATRIVFEDRSGGAEGDEDAHFRDATEGQPLELHVHGALLSHGRRRFSSAGGDARGRR